MSLEDVQSWRREDFVYTVCYCEENVWKLCEQLKLRSCSIVDSSYAVFISNHERKIPLWKQRSGPEDKDHLVIWDYHVVLAVKTQEAKTFIVDFDTVLGFVVPFAEYLNLAIRGETKLMPLFRRKFRVIPAVVYLERFASDRSHMLREDDTGQPHYASPPPDYPAIACQGSTNNIQDFISMDSSTELGSVVDLEGFINYFGFNPR